MITTKKITALALETITVFKAHSVEMGVFIASFLVVVLKKNEVISDQSILILAPIFITIAYCLNMLFKTGHYRHLYYWCWIPLLPLLTIDSLTEWSKTNQYGITVAILSPLVIFLSRRRVNNEHFIDDLLSYFYAIILSSGLSSIVFSLICGINYSILYIFGVYTNQLMANATYYTGQSILLLLQPMIFFSLLSYLFNMDKKGLRLFDIIINFILTPALLIYTTILYIYFIRIIILWELPKGGIAYMVFIFTMVAIAVKAMQYFISRRTYNWFFNHFSLISIPAQIMFWIGVERRVNEFGLTEHRVWLIICGIVMTLFLAAFAWKRLSSYFYLFALTFVLWTMMTYVPFLSPHRIAIETQYTAALKLSENTNLNLDESRRLLASIEYLATNDTTLHKTLKIKNRTELLAHIPADVRSQFEQINNPEDNLFLYNPKDGLELDIPSDFNKILIPTGNKKNDVCYTFANDSLNIFAAKTMIRSIKIADYLEDKIQKHGIIISNTELNKIAPELLLYRDDSTLIQLSNMRLNLIDEKIHINSVNIDFVLIKTGK